MQRFSHQTVKVADLKDADLIFADLNPLKTNKKKKLIEINKFCGLLRVFLKNFEDEGVTRFQG